MSSKVVVAAIRNSSKIGSLLVVVGASLLIGLFSRISIPLPFSPIPLVLQGHLCLLMGAILGARRGAAVVLLFLAQGLLGLPVFSLGRAGFPMLFGPTGGYLIGYLVATWLTGYLMERSLRDKPLLAIGVGSLVIYFLGFVQLTHFLGASKAFVLGVLPFLLTDGLKTVFAAALFNSFQRGRRNMREMFPG